MVTQLLLVIYNSAWWIIFVNFYQLLIQNIVWWGGMICIQAVPNVKAYLISVYYILQSVNRTKTGVYKRTR